MAQRLTRSLSCLAACLALGAVALGQDASEPADRGARAAGDAPPASDAAAEAGAPADGSEGQAAAADLELSEPGESAAADPLVTPLEARAELDRLAAAEDFAAAQSVGERLIELTEREFGAESVEAAEAHAAVAEVASLAGDLETAERLYLRAVDLVRSADGVYSPLAIAPLTGLGEHYQRSGQPLNALSVYSEARTVNRRAFGLLNPDQIPLIDRMTEAMQSLNRHLDADQLQLEALRLVERSYEPHSPEMLNALYKYARWLRENGRYQEERDQYVRAIRIIREHYGENSTELVRPLAAIGNSFRHQRLPDGQGVSALRDALALLETAPEQNRLALAEVLRDLGDWAVAFSKVPYDGAEYRRAWQLLGDVDGGEEMRRRWFTGPEYVLREPISQRDLSNDPDALPGHVLVKFDLSETGQTTNVSVVESKPPGLKDESVLRHVRRSRFRPQMADGRLVPGTDLALQFTYRYKLDEQELRVPARGRGRGRGDDDSRRASAAER